jgi:hypothetical protein
MRNRLDVIGAVSIWTALTGGVLLAISDAADLTAVAVAGAVLLVAGLVVFLGDGVARSRRDGLGVAAALGRSAKDAIRLAWFVFKGA